MIPARAGDLILTCPLIAAAASLIAIGAVARKVSIWARNCDNQRTVARFRRVGVGFDAA